MDKKRTDCGVEKNVDAFSAAGTAAAAAATDVSLCVRKTSRAESTPPSTLIPVDSPELSCVHVESLDMGLETFFVFVKKKKREKKANNS